MKKCLIVSGGQFAALPPETEYDFVIACDRGYAHAKRMGIRPDLLVGDFDSLTEQPDPSVPVQRLKPEKDDTDTISAVRYALAQGFERIHICCAFGGRFDHSLANVQTAALIEEGGARAVISGENTVLYSLKNGRMTLRRVPNSYLSVFSLSDRCTGVSISGTKYPLADAELTNAYPLGVSNEWTKEEAVISVEQGMLLVLVSKNVAAD